MGDMPDTDPYVAIDNALAILRSQAVGERGAVHRSLTLAIETLRVARHALTERDAELELVTAPELDAAKRAQQLTRELQAAEMRCAKVELELAMLRDEHEVEESLHAEDSERLKKLEKKAQDLDALLAQDADAFGNFMEKALDDGERKHGPRRDRS